MASGVLRENVLIKILSYLRVKSLMRFKCVSKFWCALVEKSTFIAEHLIHANDEESVIVKGRSYIEDKDAFFFLTGETFEISVNLHLPCIEDNLKVELEMIASCNGIICLHDKRYGDVALWNPATREVKVVPNFCISSPSGSKFSNCHVGFGFDVKTNDYKVIRIIFFRDEIGQLISCQTEVYNLSTDSWRLIDIVVPIYHIKPSPCPKVYLNGVYSWQANSNMKDDTMLSFVISDEILLSTPLPHVCALTAYASYRRIFTVLNDSVALILFKRTEVRFFEVWMLNDYGIKDSWTKLYIIGPIPGCPWPLGFSKNGQMFLESTKRMILPDNSGGVFLENVIELVLCDPLTQQIKCLGVEGESRSLEVLDYKESIVRIN